MKDNKNEFFKSYNEYLEAVQFNLTQKIQEENNK